MAYVDFTQRVNIWSQDCNSPKKVKKAAAAVKKDAEPPPATAQSMGEMEEAVAMDVDVELTDAALHQDIDMAMDDAPPPSTSVQEGSALQAREAYRAEKIPPKRRLVRCYTPCNTDDEGEREEVSRPAPDAPTTPSPKRLARTYGSARAKVKRMPREHEEERAESLSQRRSHASRGGKLLWQTRRTWR